MRRLILMIVVCLFPLAAQIDRATLTGIVMDQSGFKNNATVNGAKFIPNGKVGGAMQFNGRSDGGDFLSVPHSLSLVSMQRTHQLTICCWIKPAMAIEPPDGISSVVSARRVLIEGIVDPPAPPCKAFSLEISDTSVITRRLILPSVRTIGVKFSEIPNFLKLTVWTQLPIAPDAEV